MAPFPKRMESNSLLVNLNQLDLMGDFSSDSPIFNLVKKKKKKKKSKKSTSKSSKSSKKVKKSEILKAQKCSG